MFRTTTNTARRFVLTALLLAAASFGGTAAEAAGFYGGYRGQYAGKGYYGAKSLKYGVTSNRSYNSRRYVDSKSYYTKRPTSYSLRYGYASPYRGSSHFRH